MGVGCDDTTDRRSCKQTMKHIEANLVLSELPFNLIIVLEAVHRLFELNI